MASLIQGFEYDLFISYRQKDNKYDGWVTEFVDNLQKELEATFKEEVSVYFDINPHDGLLETYSVDASLREKLKCLVFIPIISQTYCDSKSFAWQHEFCAFNKMAREDMFGRDIRLPGGNVASRILPVKIHSLDEEDKSLLENELGGVLRSIEFIYKSVGVNRPLRANEDHPRDNLNKIYYRDQINKVANATKEIITAIKKYDQRDEKITESVIQRKPVAKRKLNLKIILGLLLALCIIVPGYFIASKFLKQEEHVEKTVAVLPFEKWFSDRDYSYLGDAVASQIYSQLRVVKGLSVISFNSTRRYTGQDIPSGRQIGKECGANILVQGSVELLNNNRDVIVYVQLIDAKNNSPTWDEKFEGRFDSLQEIRSEIILKIADELDVSLSPGEVKQIETGLTKSSEAYKNFLSGNYHSEAASLTMMGKKYNDSSSFEIAIKMYDKAIMYDSTFALAYARRAISRSWAYQMESLTDKSDALKCLEDIEKAIKLDPGLSEAQNAYGFYYLYCKHENKKALEHFKKAMELDPENWQSAFYLAIGYRKAGEWKKSQTLLTKVLKFNPQDALILTNIAISYNYLRDYDSALICNNKAIECMPNWWGPYFNKAYTYFLRDGSTEEAKKVIDTAVIKTGQTFQSMKILFDIYDGRFENALINTELSNNYDFTEQGDKLLHFAVIHKYLDHPDLARIYYDSARVFYVRKLQELPGNADSYSRIGIAYAGLNNRTEAIEAGRKAVKLSPDILVRDDMSIVLAQIYAEVGDFENAIIEIEDLLRNPSLFSVKLLQLDPVWKPIRDNPELKRILTKYNDK